MPQRRKNKKKNAGLLCVAMSPTESDNNKYVEITANCIRNTGAELYEFYPILKHPARLFRTDLVILNWFERLGKTRRKKCGKYILKRIILFALHVLGKKIVYVFHNRVNHEERGSSFSMHFMRCICKRADRIVILCDASRQYLRAYLDEREIQRKAFLIPHPNYIGAYGAYTSTQVAGGGYDSCFREGKINLLFAGAVRPYKNIELLIELARQTQDTPLHFVITGRAITEAYKTELLSRAEGIQNLSLVLQFVPDEALPALIEKSDALILPYDTASSLNSGTVLLAFSNKRTVLCPEIGTILEYPPEVALSYAYASPDEHLAKLKAIAGSLASQAEAEGAEKVREELREKGRRAFSLVEETNAPAKITARYKRLFAECFSDNI